MLIVITGASSGIGRAAARALAERGPQLAIVGAQPVPHERGRARDGRHGVPRRVRQALGCAPARPRVARGLPAHRRARQQRGRHHRRSAASSADGVERTWQHNVLAPFVLTQALLPRLAESSARVVFTGSEANLWGRVDVTNPGRDGRLSFEARHGPALPSAPTSCSPASWARREPALHVTSFHPGAVATGFAELDTNPLSPVIARVLRSPERGARVADRTARRNRGCAIRQLRRRRQTRPRAGEAGTRPRRSAPSSGTRSRSRPLSLAAG